MNTIRAAYLLEQCWHPVPGGTAVAAVGLAGALAARPEIELVGFAARHRAPPSGHLQPPVPVVHSALPRSVLYEAWHRLGRPAVDRLAGRPDLVHASGGAVPVTARPLVATIHDLSWRHRPDWATRRGRRLAESWLGDARRADWVVCPSEATRRDLAAAGFGCHGEYVTDPKELDAALKRADDSGKAACVVAMIDGLPAPAGSAH